MDSGGHEPQAALKGSQTMGLDGPKNRRGDRWFFQVTCQSRVVLRYMIGLCEEAPTPDMLCWSHSAGHEKAAYLARGQAMGLSDPKNRRLYRRVFQIAGGVL